MSEMTPARDKRKVAKFVLAGIAVLGIGAAATMAVWTDDVWFSAEAEAATFDLQGALSPDGPWLDVGVDETPNDSSDDTAIVIPVEEFGNVLPSFDNTVTVYLRNAGSTDIALSNPVESTTGTIFAGTDPATVTVSAPEASTLAPTDETSFDIQLTTSADWPNSYQSAEGTISVVVVGTAQ